MKVIKRAEWIVAILLTSAVLVLLITRAQHTGGLWRDECASVQVAVMPTTGELLQNFQRESFPAVFYFLLRAYTYLFGTSDSAFRSFGFGVGIGLLIVIWINARLLNREPPLVALALLGLNTTFLIWGTTIRGYGIGSVLILLTFGLVARLLLEPTRLRAGAALLAALGSVQVLLYNSVLFLAIALAALVVAFSRRRNISGLTVLGIGSVCAVSMLPYLHPFWNESRATIVLQSAVDLPWLWGQFLLSFGTPSKLLTGMWITLAALTVLGAIARMHALRSAKPAPEWDFLLFGISLLVFAVVGYLAFLEIVQYSTREWYYLALLTILAGTIDLLIAIMSRIAWVRLARLSFAAAALIVLPIFDWPEISRCQTNMDLIARKLEDSANPHDLIVMNPWYYGVSFNWYYHGKPMWVTVPMMSDHRVHRFDLLKAKMASEDAIDDVVELIAGTLRGGNKIWFVGGVEFLPPEKESPYLPPAPHSEFQWSLDAYAELWSQQIGVYLRNHAIGGQLVRVPTNGPVNNLENVDLLLIDGWHE